MQVSYIEDNACGNFHFYLKKNWNVIPALASKSISMPFAVKFLRADFEKFGFCLQIISQKMFILTIFFLQFAIFNCQFFTRITGIQKKSSPVRTMFYGKKGNFGFIYPCLMNLHHRNSSKSTNFNQTSFFWVTKTILWLDSLYGKVASSRPV